MIATSAADPARSNQEINCRQRSGYALALAILLGLAVVAAPSAKAQTFTPLYTFTGSPDGAQPFQANLLEVNGTFYGTTVFGGADGYGTVFKLNSSGKESVLYSFTGGTDGAYPNANLVRDKNGNLYGTTQNGGDLSCMIGTTLIGCGVVFKVNTAGHVTVQYAFTDGTDGAWPQGVTLDAAGNLYGVTFFGGDLSCPTGVGCGVDYELDTSSHETVVYTFTSGANGGFLNGFLTRDSAGNIYGVTVQGGNVADCSGLGCGVVFKLDTSGHQTVRYTFTGGADGSFPNGNLVLDAKGNLRGTAFTGGDLSCGNANTVGCGVVFEVTPARKEKVLHTFKGQPDGANPTLGLVRDSKGNYYSTTAYGGATNFGAVFELSAKGGEKVLYSFTGSTDGAIPESGLIMDATGNLYGNTYQGGDLSCNAPNGCGTVFKLTP
jgi:uncharacterized repeat protein (TIGR03803 family)